MNTSSLHSFVQVLCSYELSQYARQLFSPELARLACLWVIHDTAAEGVACTTHHDSDVHAMAAT